MIFFSYIVFYRTVFCKVYILEKAWEYDARVVIRWARIAKLHLIKHVYRQMIKIRLVYGLSLWTVT